jgi:hypothetical protein
MAEIVDYEETPHACDRCGENDSTSSIVEITRFGGHEDLWVICRRCTNYIESCLRGAGKGARKS